MSYLRHRESLLDQIVGWLALPYLRLLASHMQIPLLIFGLLRCVRSSGIRCHGKAASRAPSTQSASVRGAFVASHPEATSHVDTQGEEANRADDRVRTRRPQRSKATHSAGLHHLRNKTVLLRHGQNHPAKLIPNRDSLLLRTYLLTLYLRANIRSLTINTFTTTSTRSCMSWQPLTMSQSSGVSQGSAQIQAQHQEALAGNYASNHIKGNSD
nr:hypothetical protein CFP56_11212 [Quercus suber]